MLGPNASGKSTLLAGMLGARKPMSGDILLDGSPIRSLRTAERASRVAYVAQRPVFTPGYTARELVELGRSMLPVSSDAIESAIEQLGIRSIEHAPAHQLSAGQLQRVMLARACAQLAQVGAQKPDHSRVILADEPFSSLDPGALREGLQLLRTLAQTGVLVVVVLHDPAAAYAIAENALLLTGSPSRGSIAPARDAITTDALQAIYGVRFQTTDTGEPFPVLTSHNAPTDPRLPD